MVVGHFSSHLAISSRHLATHHVPQGGDWAQVRGVADELCQWQRSWGLHLQGSGCMDVLVEGHVNVKLISGKGPACGGVAQVTTSHGTSIISARTCNAACRDIMQRHSNRQSQLQHPPSLVHTPQLHAAKGRCHTQHALAPASLVGKALQVAGGFGLAGDLRLLVRNLGLQGAGFLLLGLHCQGGVLAGSLWVCVLCCYVFVRFQQVVAYVYLEPPAQ